MTWQKQIVRRTLEGAGEFPGVQLQFLLQRLEACPEAMPHIAEAIGDMSGWYQRHADELKAEARRRAGGAEIVSIRHEDDDALKK